MTAVEVKGKDSIYTWEIIGIYRAQNININICNNDTKVLGLKTALWRTKN